MYAQMMMKEKTNTRLQYEILLTTIVLMHLQMLMKPKDYYMAWSGKV